MGRYIRATALVAVLILAGFPGGAVSAPGAYQASDVLGQADFDSNTANAGAGFGVSGPDGFSGPNTIAIDPAHHRLFVADQENNRVLVFNMDAQNNLLDKTADYVLGQPDFTTFSSGTTQTKMRRPRGLDYDAAHDRLFVSEIGNRRVTIFDVATITNGEPAAHELGQVDFDTRVCPSPVTDSSLCGQSENARYDSVRDWLYVPDSFGNRVLVFDVSSVTDGEAAIHVLGQPDFDHSDWAITAEGMGNPSDVALDAAHNRLFVADVGNNRVLVYDVATLTDGEAAVHVLGQAGFTTDTANTNANGFNLSEGVAYDAINNRLYVSDYLNNRVVVFDVTSITDNEPAVGVLGQPGFTSDNQEVSQSGMINPSGMAFDPEHNRLYIAEKGNERVTIYDFVHVSAPAGALPSAAANASYTYNLGVQNAQGTVTVSVTSGALPPGLTLNSSTGVITGTPTALGTYTFEVAASDEVLGIGTFLHDPLYSITVTAGVPNTGLGGSSRH